MRMTGSNGFGRALVGEPHVTQFPPNDINQGQYSHGIRVTIFVLYIFVCELDASFSIIRLDSRCQSTVRRCALEQ